MLDTPIKQKVFRMYCKNRIASFFPIVIYYIEMLLDPIIQPKHHRKKKNERSKTITNSSKGNKNIMNTQNKNNHIKSVVGVYAI